MKTCRGCLHYDACVAMLKAQGYTGDYGSHSAERCDTFKDRTKWVERPKAQWRKYSSDEWICTHCGYDKYCDTLDGGVLPDFCEGCGADMRGEGE